MENKKSYKISDEDFIKAVINSTNIHQALVKLGLNSRGAAYKIFKNRCKKLNIDLSHFKSEKNIRSELTTEKISNAVKMAESRQYTLKLLGLNPHINSNVSWIDSNIKKLMLDTLHWKGQAHLKGKTHSWTKGKSLQEILVKNSSYTCTSNLKKKLLKNNLLEYKCKKCGINEWCGEKLSLQLEHKNGDNSDNRLENLCLLCPNCHSQTATFAGRNIK